VRTPDGAITTFDAPDAGTGFQDTIPSGINSAGAIVGYYLDPSYRFHGFLAEGE
jgi:hypothetical protein